MTLGRLARLPWAVVAVTILATLTSCGSSDDRSAEAACGSPGVAADQVKVGLVFSDSGAGSDAFSSARAGVNARFQLANTEQGGVHGRDIRYEWRDDASSAVGSRRAAEELVQDSSVFAVLPVSTVFGDALGNLQSQGVPVVGFASQSSWVAYKNFFSFGYVVDPAPIARYISKAGGKKVGFVMTGAVDSAMQIAEEYRRAFQRLNLGTTETISYVHGVDSPGQVVGRLKAAGVDSVIGFTVPRDLGEIVTAARTQGLPLKAAVSLAGYDQTMLRTSGPAMAGVSFDVHFTPFESAGPAMSRYRQAMAAYSPETQAEQQFAVLGYIYADILVTGLQRAGECPTRESFMAGLRAVHDYDAGGLIEPVDFADSSKPMSCYAFVQVNQAGSAFELTEPRLCADGATGR